MSNVKSLIDSIVSNSNASFQANGTAGEPVYDKNTVGAYNTKIMQHPQTFDAGKFKEKLSLYVLHDIIKAMMHDEVEGDLNEMIDSSIMRHIHDNYDGTCYGYLCGARDRLKSPLLGDVIQELDEKTEDVNKKLQTTKDVDEMNGEIDIRQLLKNVTDYDDFRSQIKDAVSKKVIDDVSNVITTSNDAPVFDNLDEEIGKTDDIDNVDEKDVTEESVILRMCGAIVTEYAINKHETISGEEGLNHAIVEYCINEMDSLFKAMPRVSIYAKYKI